MEQVLVLNGLGVAPTTMSITAGNTENVPRVRTFSLPANPYVSGQKNGNVLALTGLKAGQAQLVYEPETGGQVTLQINVTGLSAMQAGLLVEKTWTDIKSVLNEPALKCDWQDAAVLREASVRNAARSVLVTLRNESRDLAADGAKFQATQLIAILDYATSHPETTTLIECVLGAMPAVRTYPSWSRSGRQCQVNGGHTFRALWAFAVDYKTFLDAAAITAIVAAAIASVVATIVTLGGASVAIAGAVAAAGAAAAAGAKMIPAYKADPSKLVHDFGGAVCAAINDGALPARVRAAMKLRAVVVQKWGPFRLKQLAYNSPATSAATKAAILPEMTTYVRNAQAALVSLQTLDQPAFFANKSPDENGRFVAAAEGFRVLDVLNVTEMPRRDAGTSSGISPAVIGVGMVAAGLLAWKFLR